MPLFVTSLLVPLLVVMLRVMRADDKERTRLEANAAAKKVFSLMFSPVIMLLLGGFAVAAAMSKFHIAKAMATVVLSKAGTRPSAVLLTNMLVATFASMWISNVAAPVLCFSLIQVKWQTTVACATFDTTWTLTLGQFNHCIAYSSNFTSQFIVCKVLDSRHCFGIQRWRHGIAYQLATEHHCHSVHGPSAQLAGMVPSRSSGVLDLRRGDMGSPALGLPALQ